MEKKKEIVKCKYDNNSSCSFDMRFGDEPELVDCLLCYGGAMGDVATNALEMLAEVGAGRNAGRFLHQVLQLKCIWDLRDEILKAEAPEIFARDEKLRERPSAVIMGIDSLPRPVREALKKFMERGGDDAIGRI